MFGILNLNKPIGWTSRDAVNRVQRLVRPAKAGHAGTLDPLATGVLVVCIGPATRLISYVQKMPKVYQATFLLGRTSDSDDTETEVQELASPPQPSLVEIESKLPEFLGTIKQRPPAYSALKVNGRRAYQLAREGKEVQLEPRPVEIYELSVTGYDYPELKINLRCGSGTYVRSLGRDLAEALGTAAVMSALTRTSIGDFHTAEGLDADRLTEEELASHLQPASLVVGHLPRITLSPKQLAEIRHGRRIAWTSSLNSAPEIAAFDETGNLVAMVREKESGVLGPVRNFPLPDGSGERSKP